VLRITAVGWALGLWCVLAPPAVASAGSGDDLMRRLDAAQASQGERITVQMTRTNRKGSPREAQFVMETLSPLDGAARSKIVFRSPADVSGTAVLTVEEGDARSQWIYVPEVGMVRKLASLDRTESFASTDFTLEDLRMRSNFTTRVYELAGTGEVEGQSCTIVEDTAANDKEAKHSGYSKVRLFVEEARMLVWKVEFHDKQGRLEKVLTAHDLNQYGDIWRFDTARMTHLLDGSTTTFAGTQREMGVALDKSDFAPTVLGD
jgi:hypothetical protein